MSYRNIFGFLLIGIGIALDIAIITTLSGCATQPPPVAQAPKPKPVYVPNDPYIGLNPQIAEVIKSGQTPILTIGITRYYPYSPDAAYEVDCYTLRACEIRLAPTEDTDHDAITLADSLRWSIQIGHHMVAVKPQGSDLDPHMMTDLIIPTTEGRSYHVVLRFKARGPVAYAWYYPDAVREQYAERQVALREQSKQQAIDP